METNPTVGTVGCGGWKGGNVWEQKQRLILGVVIFFVVFCIYGEFHLGNGGYNGKNMWQTKKNVPPSKKWLLLKEDILGEEISCLC